MINDDEGHRIVVGDWSASNTMLNGRFSSSNPISFKWPTIFGTQSCDILSGVPVPGTRPRLKRQKFYAVPSGEHKGIYDLYAEI